MKSQDRFAPRRAAISAVQIACLTALLAGCGGGGTAASDPAPVAAAPQTPVEMVAIQTYITDNLATDYSKVWISIEKITAVDSAGAEATLFDAGATPAVVNLSSLAAVGRFLSTVKIPVGIYREVRVTIDNSVQLVSLDGSSTVSAKLTPTGSTFVIRAGGLAVDAAASGQLVLDFNLARFTYDAATGLVTPVVEVPKPSDAFGKLVHQVAEVNGTVKSIDTAKGSLLVDDAHLGNGVIVTLGTDAVIVDSASGKNVALAAIAVGAHVEIKGSVVPGKTTADATTVLASVIHIAAATTVAANRPATGAGKVRSVSGSLVTVALDEASFLPGANSVVVDVANARFAHGKLADLTAGVAVTFRGSVSGAAASTVVLATDVDLPGAPSQSEQQKNPEQKFAAINGAIAMLKGDGTFTVVQAKADGLLVVPGPYTIDATHASFGEGKSSCLAVGQVVQAIGTLASSTLTAKLINVKGCAGEVHSEPAPPAPPGAASAPSTPGSGAK